MCYCSDVSAFHAPVIFMAVRKKINTKQYIGFAHCSKVKDVERDADMLGKKTRTEYEGTFTLTAHDSRATGHKGDYFFTVVPLKHNRYRFVFLHKNYA